MESVVRCSNLSYERARWSDHSDVAAAGQCYEYVIVGFESWTGWFEKNCIRIY